MRSVLFLCLAAIGFLMFGNAPAGARDGCGPGRHYSPYRGICVWNAPRYGGYVPYDVYHRPRVVYETPPYYAYPAVPVYAPPPAYYADPGGYYARTIIYDPGTRYFSLWY